MTISYFISMPNFKSTAFVVWILARRWGGGGNLPPPPCFSTTSEPPCTIGWSKWRPLNGYFSVLYKMLEKHLWNSFLLYLVVEALQLVHENNSFSEVLYKRSVLKNFSKFTDKHKKQSSGEVFCQKKRCS